LLERDGVRFGGSDSLDRTKTLKRNHVEMCVCVCGVCVVCVWCVCVWCVRCVCVCVCMCVCTCRVSVHLCMSACLCLRTGVVSMSLSLSLCVCVCVCVFLFCVCFHRPVLIWHLYSDCGLQSVVLAYLFYMWVGAAYIFVHFSLSHTHKPVSDPDIHHNFVVYAADYTVNVKASWWCNWLMGMLELC